MIFMSVCAVCGNWLQAAVDPMSGQSFDGYGKIHPTIVAGTYPPIHIDLGNNEPGMTLQHEYREGQCLVWRIYLKDNTPRGRCSAVQSH